MTFDMYGDVVLVRDVPERSWFQLAQIGDPTSLPSRATAGFANTRSAGVMGANVTIDIDQHTAGR